ncbi:family 43 glycosylhydrolase [Marinimicrobium koreense]|nr:family 43 glycosylhydrolase [Marinimicrobium koreense]
MKCWFVFFAFAVSMVVSASPLDRKEEEGERDLLFRDHPSNQLNAVNEPGSSAELLKPLFSDNLLKDVSITRAEDGYYMTGTNLKKPNNGIYVWHSEDLRKWIPLGAVYDAKGERYEAPEIHYIDSQFYIVFVDVLGCIRTAKSITGDASGPYKESDCLIRHQSDPSLFHDEDGKSYLLYGHGFIAPLDESLTSVIGESKFIKPANDGYPRTDFSAQKDWPARDRIGDRGIFIKKIDGKYYGFANEVSGRMKTATDDVYVAESENLLGPYSGRYLAVPHAGQTTIFKDEYGQLYATYAAPEADRYAALRTRPAIVPLEFSKRERLRPVSDVILEDSIVSEQEPRLSSETLRDPSVTLGGDGYYYLVGTQNGYGYLYGDGGITLFRSKDLEKWEDVATIWSWSELGPGDFSRMQLWAPEFKYVKSDDTYYLTFSLCCKGVTYLFKSATGRPEGPYTNVTEGKFVDGIDGYIFEDSNGKLYFLWGGGRLGELNADRSGFVAPPRKLQTIENHHVGYEGNALAKINGKYVLTGAEWHGPLRTNGTYDMMYGVSDTIWGPYTKARMGVPHAGHGTVFKDKSGNWWTTMFGNDITAPFRMHFGLVPIVISNHMQLKPVRQHGEAAGEAEGI